MGQRDLEEELRELRARYRVMVEHAPEAIVVFDLDSGRFTEANAQACKLFGMERESLLEVGPVAMSPEVQPDGRPSGPAAMELIERAMAGEIPSFEWAHINANQEQFLARVQLARVPSEQKRLVRGSLIDISVRKELEEARARFHAILDATPDIVGIANAEGQVQYINPAGRALLGVPADEDLSSSHISDFHPEESARRILEEASPIAMRDGVWHGETEFVSRAGDVIPCSQVLIGHRDQQGNLEYISTIARDIRDRRAAEQLERKVLHAQKLESLGVLAGGIAHDFNNILVGILSNASVAVHMVSPDDEVHKMLREVQSAGERAADLARQMLDYSGMSQSRMSELELGHLATDVSRLVSASISKNAQVDFEFDDSVPPIIGDGPQLRQVLMNLIINASDALGGKPGAIKVRTALERVDRSRLAYNHLPEQPASDQYVLLEVSDTGSGIDAPLDRIFDPFFTTKFAGRGLGLAAVMGIVRAHGGGIEVETASGKGTAFRLWFSPASETLQSPAPEREGPKTLRGQGTILIVDDEDLVRNVLGMVLSRLGFDVVEAANGTIAEALFKARSGDVSAVVLDLTMPGLSGHEVLERLRKIDASVPIILTSGFSDTGVDTSKADGFLNKPFTLEQVADVLRAVHL